MYSIPRHRRELGTGPCEQGLGSRALQQGLLSFKERNSFLPSNWSFRPFLAKSTHMQLLANSGKQKCKLFRPNLSRFPCVGYPRACGYMEPLYMNPSLEYRAQVVPACRAWDRKGAEGGVTRRTRSVGQILAHTAYRGHPQTMGCWLVVFKICTLKLTKALG